jgi:hypothetical protein
MNIVKSDRGDVPGWVLITLMTAGLVVLTQNRGMGVSRFRHNPSFWISPFSVRRLELRMIQTMTSGRNPSK